MSHQLPVHNAYGRGLYDTPPLLAHPVPHQPVPQFMPNNSSLPVHEDTKIYALVIDLMDPNTREGALLELSKKREQYEDLALVLWHSFGPSDLPLPPMSLSINRDHACPAAGNRLRLPPAFTAQLDCPCIQPGLQCTRTLAMCCVSLGNPTIISERCVSVVDLSGPFIKQIVAHIPLFLYPFLNTTSKTRPFEYLRLTSLGVIGALVKVGSPSLYLSETKSGSAKRQQHCNPLPALDGNNSAVPSYNGDGF